jgi:rhamnosyltransferase
VSSESPDHVPGLKASVIVRAKNKEATIERTLSAVRSQTVPVQLIVVDSGSTDRTLDIARDYGAEIIEIPPSSFTYGGALNIGARHATGDVLFALSAHSAPQINTWVEYALEAYRDPRTAATVGHPTDPHRVTVDEPRQIFGTDLDLIGNFGWGISNHASSWRRSVWEDFPFNETLMASEDKEWMWRVLAAGYAVVVDSRLVVDVEHRWAEGVRALYKRTYREHFVASELVAIDTYTVLGTLNKWWTQVYPGRPKWQRRLSPKRNSSLIAGYFGSRDGARHRGPHTLDPRMVGRAWPAMTPTSDARTTVNATDQGGTQ